MRADVVDDDCSQFAIERVKCSGQSTDAVASTVAKTASPDQSDTSRSIKTETDASWLDTEIRFAGTKIVADDEADKIGPISPPASWRARQQAGTSCIATKRPASEEPRTVNAGLDATKDYLGHQSWSAPATRPGTSMRGAAQSPPLVERFARAYSPATKAKLAVSTWRSQVTSLHERKLRHCAADSSHYGVHYVRPASPNPLESCLYSSWKASEPEMVSVKQVESALDNDIRSFRRKYGCEEPSSTSARFTIALPEAPKPDEVADGSRRCLSLSARRQRSARPCPSPPLKEDDRETQWERPDNLPRYSKQTLAKWFKKIDIDSSGFLTMREFILAMRLHRELFEIFAQVYNVDIRGGSGGDVQQRAASELRLIRRIVHDVDTDRSGEVDWNEFCKFFERVGLLLQYQTRRELNQTSLCSIDSAIEGEGMRPSPMTPSPSTKAMKGSSDSGSPRRLSGLSSPELGSADLPAKSPPSGRSKYGRRRSSFKVISLLD